MIKVLIVSILLYCGTTPQSLANIVRWVAMYEQKKIDADALTYLIRSEIQLQEMKQLTKTAKNAK